MRLPPPPLLLIVCCCCYWVFVFGDAFPCEDAQPEDGGFVWRVAGRAKEAFFFGTIHVPHSLVRVGWAARASFDAADAVFFELDLTDPNTVHRLALCQRLPKGMTLSDVLPKDLYRRLKRHLDHVKHMIPSWTQDRELYPEYLFKAITGGWERRRPVWALLMLESLTEAGVRGGPVLDLWLARRALRMGKRAGAVEQPEEHCLPLNALNHQQVLWALNRSLTRLESGSEGATQDLIRHYNCRNLTHFAHHEEEGEIDRYFRRELIEKRNVRMAERVLRLLRENPGESFFFAFGAGHFLGNGSVLDLLRDGGGYRVEQVTSSPPPTLSHSHEWEERPYQRVQLLRSVAPNRHFNDLWVKMDRTPKEQRVEEEVDESSLAPALTPFLWALAVGLLLAS